MDPHTFELEVRPDGTVAPGLGVLVAFVPAVDAHSAVVAMSCDPRHDPGRTINELAPAVIGWLAIQLPGAVKDACWAVIDNYGRFYEAVPDFEKVGAGGTAGGVPAVEFKRFTSGISIDAFYLDAGAAGEAAIELLSAVIEGPNLNPATPSMNEFLDAVEAHGSLPAPGVIFQKVAVAAEEGDAREIANAIQPDPGDLGFDDQLCQCRAFRRRRQDRLGAAGGDAPRQRFRQARGVHRRNDGALPERGVPGFRLPGLLVQRHRHRGGDARIAARI